MASPGHGGRRRYVLVLLVLTSVTLITLDQRNGDSGPVGSIGHLAHRVVAPVSDLASNTLNPVSDWFDGVVHAGSLKRDNSRLRRALAQARIAAKRGEAARVQNRLLTRLSGQPYLDAIPSVVGRVVAPAPGNFERTITLDKGKESGIEVGMPVVAADGLVGRVFDVWDGGCTVLLLESSDFAVGVRMVRDRTTGIARGQSGRTRMSVDFIGPLAKERLPRKNELAETSGLQGSTFPPGIPVGTIESVSVSSDDLTISGRLLPLVDVDTLEYVKVLRWNVGVPVPPALTTPTTTTTTRPTAATRPTTTTTKAP